MAFHGILTNFLEGSWMFQDFPRHSFEFSGRFTHFLWHFTASHQISSMFEHILWHLTAFYKISWKVQGYSLKLHYHMTDILWHSTTVSRSFQQSWKELIDETANTCSLNFLIIIGFLRYPLSSNFPKGWRVCHDTQGRSFNISVGMRLDVNEG